MNTYWPQREKQVFAGLIAGKTEREIAADMGTSTNNVKGAKRAMFDRYHVRNKTELVYTVQLQEKNTLESQLALAISELKAATRDLKKLGLQ